LYNFSAVSCWIVGGKSIGSKLERGQTQRWRVGPHTPAINPLDILALLGGFSQVQGVFALSSHPGDTETEDRGGGGQDPPPRSKTQPNPTQLYFEKNAGYFEKQEINNSFIAFHPTIISDGQENEGS